MTTIIFCVGPNFWGGLFCVNNLIKYSPEAPKQNTYDSFYMGGSVQTEKLLLHKRKGLTKSHYLQSILKQLGTCNKSEILKTLGDIKYL